MARKFRIPKTIWSALGDIKIGPLGDKPDRLGEFDAENRVIEVKDSLPDEVAIAVFWHEVVHAALYDAGTANILRSRGGARSKEEAVCDAVALQLTGMMRAGQLSFSRPRKR
jgi:hypothetical protein